MFAVFTLLSPLFFNGRAKYKCISFPPTFPFFNERKQKKVRLEARTEFVFTIVNVQSWDGLYGRHEGTNVQLGKEKALW